MRPSRITLRSAIVAVAGVGFALAALRGASEHWWHAAIVAFLGLLCWVTLGAIALRGADRLPWLGMALFGWIFFGMTHSNHVFPDFTKDILNGLQPIAEAVHPAPAPPTLPPPLPTTASASDPAMMAQAAYQANFLEAQWRRQYFSETLVLILNAVFALAGGLAGRSFAARISRSVPGPATPAYTGSREEPS